MSSGPQTQQLDVESLLTLVGVIDRLGPDDPAAIELCDILNRVDPVPMPRPFGATECEHYAEHGWVVVPGFFDGWVRPVRDAAMAAFTGRSRSSRRPFEPFGGWSLRDDRTPETDPVIRASTAFGPSRHAVRMLLRDHESVILRCTNLFIKQPPLVYGSRWHTDTHDLPSTTAHGVNVWIPLHDAGHDSGALQLVADSHRFTEARRVELRDPHAIRRIEAGEKPELDHPIPGLMPGDYALVAPTFQAGDAFIFDSAMIHGSTGNLSDHPVLAISTLWYAPAHQPDRRAPKRGTVSPPHGS